MEDETRDFLVLIVNTIAWVLIWMVFQVFIGIYFGLAFFDGTPSWKNVLYYIFFLGSLFFILKKIKRKWNF